MMVETSTCSKLGVKYQLNNLSCADGITNIFSYYMKLLNRAMLHVAQMYRHLSVSTFWLLLVFVLS